MYVFLILLMSFTTVPMAFAVKPIETLTKQQSLDMAKEKSEIEQAINDSKYSPKNFLIKYKEEFLVKDKDNIGLKELTDIKSTNELEYGNSYKVVIADKNVMQALVNGTNLSTVLQTAPYYWEIPVLLKDGDPKKPVSSFTVDKYDGKWQVAEIGGRLSPEHSYLSSSAEDLIAFFKDHSLQDANSFIHFSILSQHMDFLYVATEDQEYFVPLIHSRDELYGLKNMTIYTRNELNSTIVPVIKEIMNDPNRAPTGYPAVKKNQQTFNFIAFFSIVVVITAIYFGYRKFIVKRSAP